MSLAVLWLYLLDNVTTQFPVRRRYRRGCSPIAGRPSLRHTPKGLPCSTSLQSLDLLSREHCAAARSIVKTLISSFPLSSIPVACCFGAQDRCLPSYQHQDSPSFSRAHGCSVPVVTISTACLLTCVCNAVNYGCIHLYAFGCDCGPRGSHADVVIESCIEHLQYTAAHLSFCGCPSVALWLGPSTDSFHSRNVETSCASIPACHVNLSTLVVAKLFAFLQRALNPLCHYSMSLRLRVSAPLMHAALRRHAKPCSDESSQDMLHESPNYQNIL
jgi:hypothetical protein